MLQILPKSLIFLTAINLMEIYILDDFFPEKIPEEETGRVRFKIELKKKKLRKTHQINPVLVNVKTIECLT